ncbi:glutaredoxin family protein [Metabacillus herbersteinensis]|uniref:Glutaredoxin family protein n=1 Tax=Metabacillus herbersteinensis TaxID=283816 RepID=A0ABV6GAZ5_9BACI
MNKSVIIYTQPECPPCKIVKQFLNHHQVPFQEVDITKNEQARNKLIHEIKSSSTPTVTVDSEVVAGFDLARLEKLLELHS